MKINRQSRKTLYLTFKSFFRHPISPETLWDLLPPPLNPSGWIYGVDGKWLKRNGVFILHRNITDGVNLYWSFWPNESYLALHHDLAVLVELLVNQHPRGAISDWKGAVVKAVNSHFGPIRHQRCLTHVTRQAKMLLPQRSPFACTLELRQIAAELIHLRNEKEIANWFTKLGLWSQRYGFMFKDRTIGQKTKRKWWYTHGNLRRAWKLLTKDTDPFFEHLKLSTLPHSNNSLEGTFSQAVHKLHEHRGMKTEQQVSFLSWYFTFSRIKHKRQLKALWDYWRNRQ